jgi:hypothetical protein
MQCELAVVVQGCGEWLKVRVDTTIFPGPEGGEEATVYVLRVLDGPLEHIYSRDCAVVPDLAVPSSDSTLVHTSEVWCLPGRFSLTRTVFSPHVDRGSVYPRR